jgi:uncharacterized protein YjbI with pentapeptide repeats
MPGYRPLGEFSHKGKPLLEIIDAHRQWLRGEGGERADLRRANLIDADLSGVYLIGANLSPGAVLIGANLSGANLIGANFAGANLVGANLSGVDLIAANLSGALLRDANLGDADLRDANMTRAILREAIMKGTILIGVNLSGANLIGANLVGADLTGATLMEADLGEANLVGADMRNSNLTNAKLIRANASGASLRDAILMGADAEDAHLVGADLQGTDLRTANMAGANLRDSSLRSAVLARTDLHGANLSGVCLDDAVLSGWIIRGVICTHLITVSSGQKDIRKFEAGQFEKEFSERERVSEMTLSIPFTSTTFHISHFIVKAINHVTGLPVLGLKGMEALSDKETKLTFSFLDNDFYAKYVKVFETDFRDALNDHLKKIPMAWFAPPWEEPNRKITGPVAPAREGTAVSYAPWQASAEPPKQAVPETAIMVGNHGHAIHDLITRFFG